MQDKSPEELDLENLARPCHLLPGPGSERSPGALARSHVSTGVLCCGGRSCPGRTSCASLGGLSMSFREVPASCTASHTLSFDTKLLALSSAPDVFKTHKSSVFSWIQDPTWSRFPGSYHHRPVQAGFSSSKVLLDGQLSLQRHQGRVRSISPVVRAKEGLAFTYLFT